MQAKRFARFAIVGSVAAAAAAAVLGAAPDARAASAVADFYVALSAPLCVNLDLTVDPALAGAPCTITDDKGIVLMVFPLMPGPNTVWVPQTAATYYVATGPGFCSKTVSQDLSGHN